MSADSMGRCILVCAGEYAPIADEAWRLERRPGDFIIAVDAGLIYLMREDIEPDLILGDFDSLEEKMDGLPESYAARFAARGGDSIVHLPVIKDDTDTMAAARIGIERGYREFWIYGGLGGRLDHTIANIQTLTWISRRGGQGWLLKEGSRTTVIGPGEFLIPEAFEGTISLFALDQKLSGVDIEGTAYDVSEAEITNDFPIGCSNEKKAGHKACIRIADGTALIVLTPGLLNHCAE